MCYLAQVVPSGECLCSESLVDCNHLVPLVAASLPVLNPAVVLGLCASAGCVLHGSLLYVCCGLVFWLKPNKGRLLLLRCGTVMDPLDWFVTEIESYHWSYQDYLPCEPRGCALPADVDRSTDIWQSEETDRVHADKQRGRDGRHDDVHPCWNSAADGSTDNTLCGPRHWLAAGHLAGFGDDRNECHDTYATRLEESTSLHQSVIIGCMFWIECSQLIYFHYQLLSKVLSSCPYLT